MSLAILFYVYYKNRFSSSGTISTTVPGGNRGTSHRPHHAPERTEGQRDCNAIEGWPLTTEEGPGKAKIFGGVNLHWP